MHFKSKKWFSISAHLEFIFQKAEFLRSTTCWYGQFLIYMSQEFDDEADVLERWSLIGQKVAEAAVTVLLDRDADFFSREDNLRRLRAQRERELEYFRIFHAQRRARHDRRNLPAPAG